MQFGTISKPAGYFWNYNIEYEPATPKRRRVVRISFSMPTSPIGQTLAKVLKLRNLAEDKDMEGITFLQLL